MTTPTRYTKKPVTIEAMQLTGPDACRAAVNWIEESTGKPGIAVVDQRGTGIHIGTLEGLMDASPGDFVIKGVKGEFYPCKPDIFAATYTAA